jgi:hypothetical protein
MARDAIARQYDVDKNGVILFCEPVKGDYRPGTITFQARKGKSIDLEKMRESIAATRLSGGTNMRVVQLEITAKGEVAAKDKDLVLKVSGADQEMVLGENPGAKDELEGLRQALAKGAKITSVTGHVQGWSGRFPDVLKALAPDPATGKKRNVLLVTDFEVTGK